MNLRLLLLKIFYRLRRLVYTEAESPPYEKKRQIIQNYLDEYNLTTFVETGTFLGDTTAYFADKCQKVYSIELSEELAEKAKSRFLASKNVKILQGDSGAILPSVLQEIGERALFWLDGHFSGTCGTEIDPIRTARGNSDTPVLAELGAILRDEVARVVLIDDARLFTGLTDYPSIWDIRRMTKRSKFNYEVSVSDDIIHIVPKKGLLA